MVHILTATLYYSEIIVGLDLTLVLLLAKSPASWLTALHDLRRRAEDLCPLD